jgi:hypothetical protein
VLVAIQSYESVKPEMLLVFGKSSPSKKYIKKATCDRSRILLSTESPEIPWQKDRHLLLSVRRDEKIKKYVFGDLITSKVGCPTFNASMWIVCDSTSHTKHKISHERRAIVELTIDDGESHQQLEVKRNACHVTICHAAETN